MVVLYRVVMLLLVLLVVEVVLLLFLLIVLVVLVSLVIGDSVVHIVVHVVRVLEAAACNAAWLSACET